MDTYLALVISCIALVVFPLLAVGMRSLLDRFAREGGDEVSFLPKAEPEAYGKGAAEEACSVGAAEQARSVGAAEEARGEGVAEEARAECVAEEAQEGVGRTLLAGRPAGRQKMPGLAEGAPPGAWHALDPIQPWSDAGGMSPEDRRGQPGPESSWNSVGFVAAQAPATEPPLRSDRAQPAPEAVGTGGVPIAVPAPFQIDTSPADDRGGCFACGCNAR